MRNLSALCHRNTISINHDTAFCSFLKLLHYGINEKDDGCNADGIGIGSI